MNSEATVRKSQLEESMEKLGIQLRYDSKLCTSFVRGELSEEWNSTRVASECAIMFWLYNHTDYPTRCQASCNFYISQSPHVHPRQVVKYVKRYIHPQIKKEVIDSCGGVPTVWPWITDNDGTKHTLNI